MRRRLPFTLQVEPPPAEYEEDPIYALVIAAATEVGAQTMDTEVTGDTRRVLVLPLEDRRFYELLDETMAAAGLAWED